MDKRKVYLAGPDVFLREAVEIGQRKKALCEDFGLIGLFPFDNEVPGDTPDVSAAIYAANVAMIREADGGIVNLTPFRGPSADAGTIFELGLLIALGKPVFAYSNAGDSLLDRTRDGETRFDPATKSWRDGLDMTIEDFGNADNLMVDASVRSQGRAIHRIDVPLDARFTDLAGFIACLHEAKAHFGRKQAAA